MRVEVVASPLRYRRAPILLLGGFAIVPAVGLLLGYQWLDTEADLYDDSRAAVADLEEDGNSDRGDSSARSIAVASERAVLSTSLFDYRRTPEPVADLANANRLAATIEPIFGFLNQTSCVAVSANGIDVAMHQADQSLVPASILKLVVAAVAIEVLGPDYVFETTVRIPPIFDGVIGGDVFLVGGGDPLLTADDYPIDNDSFPVFNTTSLDALADAFVANGVEQITGAVIGDGSRYDDEFVVEGWGDGIAFNDAGPYDALLVNDARVLGRSGVQDDPNSAAARELVRLLSNRGVRVNNGWGSGQASPLAEVIGTVRSAPLSDIVNEMLINSDNNTAEMLLKELGVVESGQGTRVAGLAVIGRTLAEWGVSLDGVRVLDGSGLDPNNAFTCRAMLQVLQRSRGTVVATGLPVAGETGTLRSEFLLSPLVGKLSAKTGTLGNPPVDELPLASKALAGYVDAGNGDVLEFVLILNDTEIADETYASLWQVFSERFDSYPAGPDAAELAPR
ncbi:MAG: D-alanyl-D-alanine carboxypeptidase/D-alanyl-D-alanine-endopeptidase (penicillin-binding protein 4) [Ilumatobacter sp.]|jgi:D-alanyl-D-alanine carboxypeptidase/D-alanyl-D-alanine-endopeptidase (penicillin-binding protein 4)